MCVSCISPRFLCNTLATLFVGGFASDRDATHMKTFVKGKAPVMQLKLSLFCFSVFSVNYFNLLFENQQQQKSVWKVNIL